MPESRIEPPFNATERRVIFARLAALADEIDAASAGPLLLGWGSTATKMRHAAGSIRWQLRWEERHAE